MADPTFIKLNYVSDTDKSPRSAFLNMNQIASLEFRASDEPGHAFVYIGYGEHMTAHLQTELESQHLQNALDDYTVNH